MPYFTISRGLRGCYMPDDVYTIKADTRRELKAAIAGETEAADCGQGMHGLSKRAVAQFAALCWREAKKSKPEYLPYALPYKEASHDDYAWGIFCSVASRREYLDFVKQQENAP